MIQRLPFDFLEPYRIREISYLRQIKNTPNNLDNMCAFTTFVMFIIWKILNM